MTDHAFHIAQVNVGRMRAPLEHPMMADFVRRLTEVNALADLAPGFVWRLADESGGAATDIRAFDDELILVNMSVWKSIGALKDFSYRGDHLEVLKERRRWFEVGTSRLALWWVEAGRIPTVEEAKAKLDSLDARGPSLEAFTFREIFPPPE